MVNIYGITMVYLRSFSRFGGKHLLEPTGKHMHFRHFTPCCDALWNRYPLTEHLINSNDRKYYTFAQVSSEPKPSGWKHKDNLQCHIKKEPN